MGNRLQHVAHMKSEHCQAIVRAEECCKLLVHLEQALMLEDDEERSSFAAQKDIALERVAGLGGQCPSGPFRGFVRATSIVAGCHNGMVDKMALDPALTREV